MGIFRRAQELREPWRHPGGRRMRSRRCQLAALTECGVHECRIQGRNFGAVVDHGAFAAAAHFDNVSIGNFIPFQSRADQLDADLVEDAVFSLFNRRARNIFNRTRAVWSASCSVMPVVMSHLLAASTILGAMWVKSFVGKSRITLVQIKV